MPQFSQTESYAKNLLSPGTEVIFQGDQYIIEISDKPTSSSGEPKTDLYLLLKHANESHQEIKISIKQKNADFLENKMKAERAQEYFGSNWKNIIMESTLSIQEQFEEKPLIYKKKQGRIEEGCITLGWKFELLNKAGGALSGEIQVDPQEVFKGISLEDDKKNAFINGTRVDNSGVAEYLLFVDNVANYSSAQDIIDNLILIDDYIEQNNPKIYFACKALNYRSLKNPAKWDGNRPLSVYVNWSIVDGKLKHEIKYDAPLTTKGDSIANQLSACLVSLGCGNTSHLNISNVSDYSICHQ